MIAARRGLFAIGSTAIASCRMLLVTIVAARVLDPASFGSFSILLILYSIIAGSSRALLVESFLSAGAYTSGVVAIPKGFIVTVPVSVLLAVGGIYLDNNLLYLALFIPGFVAFDQLRTIELTLGKMGVGLALDGVWTAAVILVSLLQDGSASGVYKVVVVWAASPTVLAACFVPLAFFRARKMTHSESAPQFLQIAYLFDYLIGSGSAQLSQALIPTVSSAAVVGAIRGAGTILSPLTQIATAARPLLLASSGAARRDSSGGALGKNARIACLLIVLLVPCAFVVASLPDWVGRALLGESWTLASLVVGPLGIEIALTLVAQVAFAAHRAIDAARRIIVLRLVLAALRVPAILVVAYVTNSPVAVAWAMVAVSVVGTAVWWTSYYQLDRVR